ncbi:MAG: hypothetical protein RQ751_12540, partial [Longimicrobiales bacterium]|nr:hypothetical protein [Longimicrobiales bacterium]
AATCGARAAWEDTDVRIRIERELTAAEQARVEEALDRVQIRLRRAEGQLRDAEGRLQEAGREVEIRVRAGDAEAVAEAALEAAAAAAAQAADAVQGAGGEG